MALGGLLSAGAGSALGFLGGLLGEDVEVPQVKPIQTSEELSKAAAANLGVLGQAEQLAAQVNKGAQQRLLESLQAAIPGYGQMVGKTAENIQANLSGQIPEDVQRAIQRAGAAKAVAGGFAGSQFGRNLTARDLGLTSLQLMNQGVQQSNQFLANARHNLTAPQFDVSNMFVSPAQQLQVAAQNAANQWNAGYLQNQLTAAQSPMTGFGRALGTFGGAIGSGNLLGGFFNQPSTTPVPSTGGFGGAMSGLNVGINFGRS